MADSKAQIAWHGDIARPTGLAWLADAAVLLVCDPGGGRVASFDPANGAMSFVQMDGATSFCFPTRDGQLLMGEGLDLVRLDGDGNSEVEIRIDMPGHLRTGTGAVDPMGRLWFSAPDERGDEGGNADGADGRVYRYHDGRMVPTLFDRTRPGGIALSAEGRRLYHANGGARRIELYHVNSAGAVSNGETLVRLPDSWGEPRGLAMGGTGDLWVACSEGRIGRVSTKAEVVEALSIGVEAIDLAFGGEDLATLYISAPGTLFAIEAGTQGQAVPPVKLSLGETLGLIEDDDH